MPFTRPTISHSSFTHDSIDALGYDWERIAKPEIYVKAISSPYLTRASNLDRHCELMLYLGLDPEHMTDAVLNDMVSEVDDLCIAHRAFRYMHSKTVKDQQRQLVDPNAIHAALTQRRAAVPEAAVGAPPGGSS